MRTIATLVPTKEGVQVTRRVWVPDRFPAFVHILRLRNDEVPLHRLPPLTPENEAKAREVR